MTISYTQITGLTGTTWVDSAPNSVSTLGFDSWGKTKHLWLFIFSDSEQPSSSWTFHLQLQSHRVLLNAPFIMEGNRSYKALAKKSYSLTHSSALCAHMLTTEPFFGRKRH